MAWGDLVQYKTGTVPYDGTQTYISVTFDSAPTEGNLLVACHYSGNGYATQPSGWSVAFKLTQPVNDDDGGLYYKIAGSSESSTVTATVASANEHIMLIAEFEGPWVSSPLDTEDHSDYAASDDPIYLTTSALSQADNLIVAMATGRDWGAEPIASGADFTSGFTDIALFESTNKFLDVDYKVISSSSAQSATWDAVAYFEPGQHAGIAVFMKGSTTHELSATGIESTPKLGSPDAGQIFNLSSDSLKSTSELDTSIIGSTHNLLSDGLVSETYLGRPAMGQTHLLLSESVESASEISTPTGGIAFALTANSLSSNSEVDIPVIHVRYQLESLPIAINTILDRPLLLQPDALESKGIFSNSEIGIPQLGQVHTLSSVNAFSRPRVQFAGLGQIFNLLATSMYSPTSVQVAEADIPLVRGTILIRPTAYRLDFEIVEDEN